VVPAKDVEKEKKTIGKNKKKKDIWNARGANATRDTLGF
jgi:hypothetical protein